jgi:hypothetical protein
MFTSSTSPPSITATRVSAGEPPRSAVINAAATLDQPRTVRARAHRPVGAGH